MIITILPRSAVDHPFFILVNATVMSGATNSNTSVCTAALLRDAAEVMEETWLKGNPTLWE